MKNDIYDTSVKSLFEGIICLETVDECYAFFEDICTPNEMLSIAQRFQVGEMRLDRYTYKDITAETGASTTTISRVNRLLKDNMTGLEMVYQRKKERKRK